MPMSMRTPSRMSRMTSGGALSERISARDSVFMLPTADLASYSMAVSYTDLLYFVFCIRLSVDSCTVVIGAVRKISFDC